MIKNYIRICVRNLARNKVFTTINILGLAVGMSIAILIGLWVWDEVSFNHYFKNHKQLGEIASIETFNGETITAEFSSVPIAEALRTNYPQEIQKAALIGELNAGLLVGDKKINAYGYWAEAALPSMLSLHMKRGNYTSFNDPSSILISEALSKSLFGSTDPIGKTISFNNEFDLKVAGVYEDLPANTDFRDLQFLGAWTNKNNIGNTLGDDWTNHHFQLFVQVNENSSFKAISSRIKDLTKPHIKGSWEELMVHPMDKWHLYTDFKGEGRNQVNRIQFVRLFGIIGIFVLALACINFMTLSTARSEKRSKEVGIRKTMGSSRIQLIRQFITESIALTLIASIFSLTIAWLALPTFNRLAGKELEMPFTNFLFWICIVGFTLLTGLIAGSYPAFFLSAFNPIKVLKGNFKTGKSAALPRKIMVVFQFTVCISLIVGTIIVYRQIQFAKERPIGYSPERLITIEMNSAAIRSHFDALRHDLLQTGAVENAAESSSPSTDVRNSMIGYSWKGKDPNMMGIVGTLFIGYDFGKTVDWTILDGRDFSRDFPADSGAYILNEAAVHFTGLKNPVGQVIHWHDADHPIIGVVKNMVMGSPYQPSQPTFFTLSNLKISVITIRLKKDLPVPLAISKIENVFKNYDPESPFDFGFTQDAYNFKFSNEEHVGNLSSIFCILAIFIASLGLFGLASFIAEQRTKELAVRKVLGATVVNLWVLLSAEFITQVLISCLIASPIAWLFLQNWLQQYEYRTSISGWVFVVAGSATMAIALITVSTQIIRASRLNPVNLLRSE